MPIFLRNFWVKKVNSILDSKQAAHEAHEAQLEAIKNRRRSKRK
jgi:hypothetical protein